jgi:hypothetical protein
VIVFMALLCIYEIVKRLVVRSEFEAKGLLSGSQDPPPAHIVAPSENDDPPPPVNYPMLFGGIASVAAYVFATPWLGFFPATALFLFAFPWIGGLRRPVVAAVVSLAGTVVLAITFLKLAYISLPLGEGPFRALSLALMRLVGVN